MIQVLVPKLLPNRIPLGSKNQTLGGNPTLEGYIFAQITSPQQSIAIVLLV